MLNNLYSDQGKLSEAEEMYNQALEEKEKTIGCDHSSTLDTVGNIGLLHHDQGKLREAEEMYSRALKGYGSALGPTHPKSYVIMRNSEFLRASRDMNPVKS